MIVFKIFLNQGLKICAFLEFFVRLKENMLIRNKKGQMAIFVVLIFQVLFILFAMTINIALVVHDKINFQNSLDLAAYYGAKKQAEVLNAMAHINYQMRQNWKLLAWRYRILGTLLQREGWPTGTFAQSYWCPQNRNELTYCTLPNNCGTNTNCINACNEARSSGLPYSSNYCDDKYFVCISNRIWKRGLKPDDQNLCITLGTTVKPITVYNNVLPYMPSTIMAQDATLKLQRQVGRSCPIEGALNALLAHLFVTHFRLDQRDRKSMIRAIYEKTLQKGVDLDGNDIFAGVKKVFFNNLSRSNQENVKGLPDYGLERGFNSFEDELFTDVFNPLDVWPILQVLYLSGSLGDACSGSSVIPHNEIGFETIQGKLGVLDAHNRIHDLHGHLGPDQEYFIRFNEAQRAFFRRTNPSGVYPMKSLVLGFFKEKKKILYYGLKGEFQAKNPIFSLSLSDGIEFRGSSFAKAFGGRFGPQPEESDHLIPLHHPNAPTKIPNNSSGVNIKLLQPNYSRWPGDTLGLIDNQLHNNSLNNPSNFLKKHEGRDDTITKGYTMEAFFHLIFYNGRADDPLSRPPVSNSNRFYKTFMRMVELVAVYPDAYDLSYYSITGNYMQTYFPKICKLLKGGECQVSIRNENSHVPDTFIRGDFGWPETQKYIDANKLRYDSIGGPKTDLSIAPYFLKRSNSSADSSIDTSQFHSGVHVTKLTKGQFFYPWLAHPLPGHLLSSWAPPRQLDYETYDFPDNNFLKCDGRALENMPVASACVQGGRSGYSVKLISCETARSINDDTDTKQLSAIDEYCPPP